jgi:hypothetical protein
LDGSKSWLSQWSLKRAGGSATCRSIKIGNIPLQKMNLANKANEGDHPEP